MFDIKTTVVGNKGEGSYEYAPYVQNTNQKQCLHIKMVW